MGAFTPGSTTVAVDWARYGTCPTCDTEVGRCLDLAGTRRAGKPFHRDRPHLERPERRA